jgi:hypothetical protein
MSEKKRQGGLSFRNCAAQPKLQLTGPSPGGYATDFARFGYGSRMDWGESRPATEIIVGQRMVCLTSEPYVIRPTQPHWLYNSSQTPALFLIILHTGDEDQFARQHH